MTGTLVPIEALIPLPVALMVLLGFALMSIRNQHRVNGLLKSTINSLAQHKDRLIRSAEGDQRLIDQLVAHVETAERELEIRDERDLLLLNILADEDDTLEDEPDDHGEF